MEEDEPSFRRRRLPVHQESNHSGTDVQMARPAVRFMLTSNQESDLNNVSVRSSQTLPSRSMNTSTNSITMQPTMPMLICGSNSIQSAFEEPSRAFGKQVQPSIGSSTCEYYHNQSGPSASQGFQLSSGASSSSAMAVPHKVDVYTLVGQMDDFVTFPAQESAVQMDTNPNQTTLQQMASLHTSKDEILQQHVHNLKKSVAMMTID
ncbi:hypothetical protein Tco_1218501 [Tanacetum coccineum]